MAKLHHSNAAHDNFSNYNILYLHMYNTSRLITPLKTNT